MNIGLQDVPFIQAIIVHPQNPNVAVIGGNSVGIGILWRPYPKSALTDNRGIFKTEDGGTLTGKRCARCSPLTLILLYASQTDLVAQRDLAITISQGMESSYEAYQGVAIVRKQPAERLPLRVIRGGIPGTESGGIGL